MISVSSKGSFDNLERYISRMQNKTPFARLEQFGQEGVDALSSATSIDSGLTASSWKYRVRRKNGKYTVTWYNENVVSGVPIAIILQYGHATGTGGWVEGEEYINDAIRPIFDKLAENVWKEVTRNA